MKSLVAGQNWHFDPRLKLKDWSLKDINYWLSDAFEKVTHYRIGEYKNYQLLKEK